MTGANVGVVSAGVGRWHIGDGQIEALKWIALASMFTDHIGRLLLGHDQQGWVFALGRVAFPLFALVLGINLARPGDGAGRAARSFARLALWCGVAVIPSILARDDPYLVNVLGTLALGAAMVWALASAAALPLRMAACLAAAAASWFVEFGLAGVFMVPVVYLLCAQRPAQPGTALLLAALWLATAWLNASFGGALAFVFTLAGLPLVWLVARLPLRMPRWQLGFYAIYPLHLLVIGLLKRAA